MESVRDGSNDCEPNPLSDFVTNPKFIKTVKPSQAECSVPSRPALLDAKALPLDWLLNPEKDQHFSDRVLARLIQAEAHAGDPYEKLAYTLAWHIVLHCKKGDAVECSPVTLAYYTIVGCHESQYYDRLMIRRATMFGTEVNKLHFPSLNKSKQKIASGESQSPSAERGVDPLAPKSVPINERKRA